MDCRIRKPMSLARQPLRSNGPWRRSFPGVVAVLGSAVLLASACSWSEPKSDGKTLSEHFELLKSPDPEIRFKSARSIESLAEEADLFKNYRHFEHRLPEMLDAMKDSDSRVRKEIVGALSYLKEPTPGAIPQILELARSDPDDLVRVRALGALRRARAEQMDLVLPFLLEILQNADTPVDRIHVASILGAIGPPAARAIPAILTICPQLDTGWCRELAEDLKWIDPNWRERPEVQALLAEAERSKAGKETSPEAQ
jgi:hypothetical protein